MGARRKKFPELAQRCNDILPTVSNQADFRAKSEERSKLFAPSTIGIVPGASIRSKSAEPSRTEAAFLVATEYRSAFRWPPTILMSRSETEACGKYRRRHQQDFNAVETNGKAKKSATIANFKDEVDRHEPNGRPHILFAREAIPIPLSLVKKHVSKSEYKAKYRPFSTYMYVSGNGWKKSKNVAPLDDVHEWYAEVSERGRKANEFRSRSQFGHQVNAGGLEEVYKNCSDGFWAQPKPLRNCDITALELAATQMKIAEKRAERASSRSVSPVKSDKSSASRARKGK